MSEISTIIPSQGFELIYDRIGVILADELENQATLANDDDLKIPIYKERDIPFNDSELPAINIMFEGDGFELQTNIQHDGSYRYTVEVIANAPSNDAKHGDTLAMIKVQKIIGKIRSIIMNPAYIKLGFTTPFIKNRRVENIIFGKPIRQDTSHTVMGRLTIMVACVETTPLEEAPIVNGVDTSVRLFLTEKGFMYRSYFAQ